MHAVQRRTVRTASSTAVEIAGARTLVVTTYVEPEGPSFPSSVERRASVAWEPLWQSPNYHNVGKSIISVSSRLDFFKRLVLQRTRMRVQLDIERVATL